MKFYSKQLLSSLLIVGALVAGGADLIKDNRVLVEDETETSVKTIGFESNEDFTVGTNY